MTCALETDLRDWQLATLKELAEIGMALARELPAQTAAAPEARPAQAPAPDPVLAFSRISRAVRLTLALQTRILEGPAARPERRESEPEARAAEAAAGAELEDRRLTGRLRRSMTRFIAETAIEAVEREAPETERLFDALDARLDRDGDDDADFADIEVTDLALAVCRDLGVDPGPDWWREGWGIDSPPPQRSCGGGGDERREERLSEAEAGPNGGGGGDSAPSASGAASAPPPMFHSD